MWFKDIHVQEGKICHAHLHFLESMCSKFHLDDLKTVQGDTIFI